MNVPTSWQYRVGCPVWACADWQGSLYKNQSPRDQWLAQYSHVFKTVEGNSTFYGLPEPATVRRWCQRTSDGFRFTLKFPQSVTHEHQLQGADDDLDRFLDLLGILEEYDRLGPSLLQLPPFFEGAKLNVLDRFLTLLPAEFPIAVEVRHRDYFDDGPVERSFVKLLRGLKVDQALFDSRPLFSAAPDDEVERASQKRKPQSPHRCRATGCHPLLRLIGRNQIEKVAPWIDEWAKIVAEWIVAGRSPYVFTHAPDDRYAPALAEMFHVALQRHLTNLPDLPAWPGRGQATQMTLFE